LRVLAPIFCGLAWFTWEKKSSDAVHRNMTISGPNPSRLEVSNVSFCDRVNVSDESFTYVEIMSEKRKFWNGGQLWCLYPATADETRSNNCVNWVIFHPI